MTKKNTETVSEVVDINFLQTITDGDQEFEKELLTTFIESCNNNLEKMRKAIKTKDNNAWYMSSHSFKGASASIGAFDLSSSLEAAQTYKEEDYEGKTKLLKEVEEKFTNVVNFLKSANFKH